MKTSLYICPGADVLVVSPAGDWIGRCLQVADRAPLDAVLDPCGNPKRQVGQRILVSLHSLRAVPR